MGDRQREGRATAARESDELHLPRPPGKDPSALGHAAMLDARKAARRQGKQTGGAARTEDLRRVGTGPQTPSRPA